MNHPATTTSSPTKPLITLITYFGALFALFLLSDVANAAQGLGEVAEHVTGSMEGLAKLLAAASYVAGIGFALAGMMKFKAHKDNPTQVPLSQPMVLLFIAAGLVFLPSVIDTAGETIFQGGQKGDATGSGL
jgi:hypothetical protein